jgi:hypothetical protein
MVAVLRSMVRGYTPLIFIVILPKMCLRRVVGAGRRRGQGRSRFHGCCPGNQPLTGNTVRAPEDDRHTSVRVVEIAEKRHTSIRIVEVAEKLKKRMISFRSRRCQLPWQRKAVETVAHSFGQRDTYSFEDCSVHAWHHRIPFRSRGIGSS